MRLIHTTLFFCFKLHHKTRLLVCIALNLTQVTTIIKLTLFQLGSVKEFEKITQNLFVMWSYVESIMTAHD